jgi:hypothetical protein
MTKKRCVISFSGGETSAYMLWYLLKHHSDEYEFVILFANTGQEDDETLWFVKKCAEYFGVEIIWVEAQPRFKIGGVVQFVADYLDKIFDVEWVGGRVGTTYKVVNFETATRLHDWKVKPTPFEAVIAKFGIPNVQALHCTRELKERPITHYVKYHLGWTDYYTAIGIRADEFDRINENRKDMKLIYPLVSIRPMTKGKINFWWSQQPFRLTIKGYEGNCVWCYKKYVLKHYTLAQERPDVFDFPKAMEKKYENYVPESRIIEAKKKGKEIKVPIRFFRGNKTVDEIMHEAGAWDGQVKDDRQIMEVDLFDQQDESCEVFTKCGS